MVRTTKRPLLGSAVILAAATVMGAAGAHAAISVTLEAPGAVNTTASGTLVVDNFDGYTAGNYTSLVSPLGTYNILPNVLGNSGNFTIDPADVWGGAGGTGQYLHDNRPKDDFGPIQLVLDQDRAYFGFWWSAGSPDAVTLYNDGAPIFTFSTQDVIDTISGLPNASLYYGNPFSGNGFSAGDNGGEFYAFINFYADVGTVFDEIRLSGDLIESDNHTVSSDHMTPQGVPVVPEPTTGAIALTFLAGLAAMKRRQQRA